MEKKIECIHGIRVCGAAGRARRAANFASLRIHEGKRVIASFQAVHSGTAYMYNPQEPLADIVTLGESTARLSGQYNGRKSNKSRDFYFHFLHLCRNFSLLRS